MKTTDFCVFHSAMNGYDVHTGVLIEEPVLFALLLVIHDTPLLTSPSAQLLMMRQLLNVNQ
jgi:hypothetical protein